MIDISTMSVVSCQLSVVSCQLPVASCQLPVASCQLPVVTANWQLGNSSTFKKGEKY
ncbi:hypothetical protein QUF80_11945 [Desulfococcaceae bacterium HSG8]|nr:hypothetical protein [Desulfococcaceae bacterium HSG8]